jgi:hypothetical protein
MPDEIQRDGPVGRIDQGPRGGAAGLARPQRVKAHGAEDPDQGRCEGDLGWNEFADEGQPEILDFGAAHLLDEGDPVMIGVPPDDRRKHRHGDQPAEIGPWRGQPAPQCWDADQPDQDGRAEEQRCVFRQ